MDLLRERKFIIKDYAFIPHEFGASFAIDARTDCYFLNVSSSHLEDSLEREVPEDEISVVENIRKMPDTSNNSLTVYK
jgi:hypothetical protein